MKDLPETTVKVIKVAPCGDTQVCITLEMIVDMNRMAEVSSEMLHAAIVQTKAQAASRSGTK